MMFKVRNLLLLIGIIVCHSSYGQDKHYQFKRTIDNVSEMWHKIEMPDEIFEKTNANLSDIRIMGYTNSLDTIEVPYLINILDDQVIQKEVDFKLLNQSKKGNQYFFFLEIPSREEINRIGLSFQEKNFDWKVSLEGSQRLDDWYSIIEDYRVVSVKNQWTDYSFTSLSFPKSLYRYYRMTIEADTKPNLLSASVNKEEIIPGTYKNQIYNSIEIQEDKKRKETIIDFSLPFSVPVSSVLVNVNDTVDYYRSFSIQYLSDSSHTPKGWTYHYRTVYSGVLNSLEKNDFSVPNAIASKWRIIISNQDNAPLKFGKLEVKSSIYELIARFTEPANYYLLYGSPSAGSPAYDLENFKEKIPKEISNLALGEEEVNFQKDLVKVNPLFENQLWLWGIMGVIIIVLGAFSLKLIRKTG